MPDIQRPLVASITVAWNGFGVVSQHLNALMRQSVPLAEVVVVDNHSTDGTPDLLSRDFPSITVLRMAENLGVGGGFAAGVEYALARKHDWFWLFDQDSTPTPTALARLLEAFATTLGRARNIGVLACASLDPQHGMASSAVVWRNRFVPAPSQEEHRGIIYADSVISSGSLIRREVVEEVGFPRRDFFIDLVDNEFNMRIRRKGYKIVLVRDSVMYHSLGETRPVRRLKYWGRVRLRPFEPTWRHYYMSRNETFIVWHLYGTTKSRVLHLLWVLRRTASIVWYDRDRAAKLWMHLAGTWHGLTKEMSRWGPLRTRQVQAHGNFSPRRDQAGTNPDDGT